MDSVLEDQSATRKDLQRRLAGRFRTRGLLAPEHGLISADGKQFGRLCAEDSGDAILEAGVLSATIEHDGGAEYRIISGGTTMLMATPESRTRNILEIRVREQTYRAKFSPFRNISVARSRETGEYGNEISHLKGGLAGRGYEAFFDARRDRALPVAILLLHHATALRRIAYQT